MIPADKGYSLLDEYNRTCKNIKGSFREATEFMSGGAEIVPGQHQNFNLAHHRKVEQKLPPFMNSKLKNEDLKPPKSFWKNMSRKNLPPP